MAALMAANGVLGLTVLNIGALNKIGALCSMLLGEGKCAVVCCNQWCLLSQTD